MKALAGLGIVLSIVGCRVVQDSRSVVIMQPHEGTYLWISPESQDKLGAGGELQIYVDPETHPEAKASVAKFTLGVIRKRTSPQRDVQRARIILCCADGLAHRQTKRELHTSIDTILRWRSRYEEEGLDGLKDRPRPGRPPTFSPSGAT